MDKRYRVWDITFRIFTYKTESSPIVKITEPSTSSHIIEGKGLESFDDDIDNIENWIRQNRDDLLAYWAQDIDYVELSERLL